MALLDSLEPQRLTCAPSALISLNLQHNKHMHHATPANLSMWQNFKTAASAPRKRHPAHLRRICSCMHQPTLATPPGSACNPACAKLHRCRALRCSAALSRCSSSRHSYAAQLCACTPELAAAGSTWMAITVGSTAPTPAHLSTARARGRIGCATSASPPSTWPRTISIQTRGHTSSRSPLPRCAELRQPLMHAAKRSSGQPKCNMEKCQHAVPNCTRRTDTPLCTPTLGFTCWLSTASRCCRQLQAHMQRSRPEQRASHGWTRQQDACLCWQPP